MPKSGKPQGSASASGPSSRVETVLAYMAVGVIGVSLVSMLIVLVSSAAGAAKNFALLAQIPLIGLPLGALLIIALVVTGVTRRSRENRG